MKICSFLSVATFENSHIFGNISGVQCQDTDNGPRCGPCPPGFSGDGKSCNRLYTCELAPCFPGVECRDTAEGPKCGQCPAGFSGDGRSCTRFFTCNDNPCFPGENCQFLNLSKLQPITRRFTLQEFNVTILRKVQGVLHVRQDIAEMVKIALNSTPAETNRAIQVNSPLSDKRNLQLLINFLFQASNVEIHLRDRNADLAQLVIEEMESLAYGITLARINHAIQVPVCRIIST